MSPRLNHIRLNWLGLIISNVFRFYDKNGSQLSSLLRTARNCKSTDYNLVITIKIMSETEEAC